MIHIFGHKNPDSDSVCSAIALNFLKNSKNIKSNPFVLGSINKETTFILNHFNINAPSILKNVNIEVKDLNYDTIKPVSSEISIFEAYNKMKTMKIRTLPVTNDTNKLVGILTMKDITIDFISGNKRKLDTTYSNVTKSLGGKLITETNRKLVGNILVIALYHKTLKKDNLVNNNTIAIVGDNYEAIDFLISENINSIIVTGGRIPPKEYIEKANRKNINIISVPIDTYETSRQLTLCNKVSSIMKSKNIIRFKPYYSIDEVKEDMSLYKYTNYPVLDKGKQYLGMVNRNHIISPNKKKVILVDHNEYSQSVPGLKTANILEIIDHHKIGDINTNSPISFRNMPVGSTCTIVYSMFREENIKIPKNIAGCLISGIISDTLFFRSPTTTSFDKIAVEKLNETLNMDLDQYAHNMFKYGSSLEGEETNEILNKDYKEFDIEGLKIGISQIFTLNIDEILERKDEFLHCLEKNHIQKNNDISLIVITDILKEGSHFLYKSDNTNIIKYLLNDNLEQGYFSKGIISRKKQIVPLISEAIIAQKNM
ncbi:putative manganese-dependent inorganic diphosphatase [Helicovermis profundi]|uniref:inorganic diphosphatase n=1 Tax=Helicovermis profundi TaxID=3065157 RepID=A0AAU9E9Z9_9FIRM|nr:putative manganese-dependent inorganic diphosphatase [Clostridia bacterium S502]